MIESASFAYKNSAVTTVEIDLSAVAPYLPPQALASLQNAIRAAIQAAMAPLVDEIASLREDVDRQGETITAQAGEIATLRERLGEVDEIKDEVATLEDDLQKLRVWSAPQKAEDAMETALEAIEKVESQPSSKPSTTPQGNVSETTEGHMNHVRALLLRADHNRMTVKDLASRIGRTKQRMWTIVHEMQRRGLVNVIGDPHHRQRQLVELRPYFGTASET